MLKILQIRNGPKKIFFHAFTQEAFSFGLHGCPYVSEREAVKHLFSTEHSFGEEE